MIEEMKYINIMGPLDCLDVVIEKYIANYDIQLENAVSEFKGNVSSYISSNPYTDSLRKAEIFLNMPKESRRKYDEVAVTNEKAVEIVNVAYNMYERRETALKELEQKKDKVIEAINSVVPFIGLDFNITSLFNLKYIHFRFGKMPTYNYKQFETFVYHEPEILFVKGSSNAEVTWGAYFVPEPMCEKVDSIFASLHFERVFLRKKLSDYEVSGSLKNVHEQLISIRNDIQNKIDRLHKDIMEGLSTNNNLLLSACHKITQLHFYYDAIKLAGKTSRDYFIFVGWMTKKDADRLQKAIEKDKDITLLMENDKAITASSPPTKLKNLPIIKYFEFFVKMYGLPSYTEMDPTPVLALTYTILFGVMFGDLGQGAVLSLLGLFLYKARKMPLGAVLSVIGVSSMFFGTMYGSFFGYEHIIPTLWTKPSENITTLLVATVIFGVLLIFIAMAVNIVNSVRNKNYINLLLGPNGLSGIVFYAAIMYIVYSIFFGNGSFVLTGIFTVVFIILPLIAVAFKEPIEKLIEKKRVVEGGTAMFVFQTVIELFEVLLSYFTNTVSFVRVGAFALSHAGILSVVMMLSENANGGNNLVVVVLGNILVMGLEGLLAGIQVLRLEFYEIFSRFYQGEGREFTPYKINRRFQ